MRFITSLFHFLVFWPPLNSKSIPLHYLSIMLTTSGLGPNIKKAHAVKSSLVKKKALKTENKSKFGWFTEATLFLHFPSLFLLCSTVYYIRIFCAFHHPNILKWYNSGIIKHNMMNECGIMVTSVMQLTSLKLCEERLHWLFHVYKLIN